MPLQVDPDVASAIRKLDCDHSPLEIANGIFHLFGKGLIGVSRKTKRFSYPNIHSAPMQSS
jgi:hypothetical protein